MRIARTIGCLLALAAAPTAAFADPPPAPESGGISGLVGARGVQISGQRPAPTIKVVLAEPTLHGDLSADAVREVLAKLQNQVSFCYGKHVIAEPDSKGEATFRMTVGPDGAVSEVAVDASDVAAALVECVQGRLATAVFPANEERAVATVTQPISFQPATPE